MQKTTTNGRLDEYIRSFEERYGVVPIDEANLPKSEVNESLASISSISLERSGVNPTREPAVEPHPAVACRANNSLHIATVSTPRFPQSEEGRLAASVDAKLCRGGGLDETGQYPVTYGVKNVGNIGLSYFDTPSTVGFPFPGAGAHHSGLTASDMGVDRLRQTMISPARRMVEPSSLWASWTPILASNHHQGSLGNSVALRAPCERPERARASSNPPAPRLMGPRNAPRPIAQPVEDKRVHRKLKQGFNGHDEFASPLRAPRGNPPQRDTTVAAIEAAKAAASAAAVVSSGARPRKAVCNSVELARPPRLSSSEVGMPTMHGLLNSELQKVDRLSLPTTPPRANLRSPGRSLVPDVSDDEVNCQSPVRIPQPSKLLRRAVGVEAVGSEIAVQTEAIEEEQEECDPECRADLVNLTSASCDAGVQTDRVTAVEVATVRCSPDKLASPPPTGDSAHSWQTSQSNMRTPDQLCMKGVAHSTPDFGEVELSFAASQLKRWQEPVVPGNRPSSLDPTKHWIEDGSPNLCMKQCGVSKAQDEMSQLKERLQNALARGLTHLQRLQVLAG